MSDKEHPPTQIEGGNVQEGAEKHEIRCFHSCPGSPREESGEEVARPDSPQSDKSHSHKDSYIFRHMLSSYANQKIRIIMQSKEPSEDKLKKIK
jgi:hypothetical protein